MTLQIRLPLSPTDGVQSVHGRHQSGFVLAQVRNGEWQEGRALPVAEGINETILNHIADTYFSVSGIAQHCRREFGSVTYLTSHFVDFDIYNLDVSRDTAITAIESQCDELKIPEPTIIASSGRGLYAFWLFDKPFYVGSTLKAEDRAKRMGAWQYAQATLVKAFANIGADPAAKDAARVLRLPGSINSKSGQTVTYYETGSLITNPAQQLTEPLQAAFYKPKAKATRKPKSAAQGKSEGHAPASLSLYTLASARRYDIERLGFLRGGFKDCRARALFAYAAACTISAPTEASLLHQVRTFAESFIVDPQGKYKDVEKRLKAILDRYRASNPDPYDDERVIYRQTNATLLRWLEITEAEERKLTTIISNEEKERRRTKKRRDAGVKERAVYERERQEQAEQKREQAQCLLSEGKSVNEIAQVMGIKRQNVYRYLK